ncbi:major facilitator transporter [Amycolatopsis mediterranei S699]|uniref:Major facilitator transporter n=3 Tax=Amycolatopsis mediterranei TaxID=33910 RepID=A0A0H3D163_AMYMU|nr:MFS transporter [Amycolatopsis mediterranei]ADJ43226.1 major facilitator transporter [Amycolatopsis mediterranei U32]AEK39924.1 major facilitator transporter [Amycolatopsis mediterranei S699]AFO74939.1 major facilitator transporter [Amycolatopsis mediterranei S699]AGT82068.1 major facilitator transporter [Amycolatopsis mediterranei RB]KDO05138.1 MFS transporter [Amycolatopsis mediterranei]
MAEGRPVVVLGHHRETEPGRGLPAGGLGVEPPPGLGFVGQGGGQPPAQHRIAMGRDQCREVVRPPRAQAQGGLGPGPRYGQGDRHVVHFCAARLAGITIDGGGSRKLRAKDHGSTKVKLGGRFHRLFAATLVSATGTGMHAAALPLLVLQITSSPVALSLVVVAVELPWVLVSLYAGVVVDRLDRRRVMVWADAGRFAVLAALVVLILTSRVNLVWLVLAAFALGVGQVFFDLAAQSAVPDFVSRDPRHLSTANGRIAAAESNGEDFVGPPLGSALFGVWNVLPFAGNALSFAASGVLIRSIRADGTTEVPSGTLRKSARLEIVEGIRWLLGNRTLRALAVITCLSNVVASAQFAMLALLAKQVLRLPDVGFGLLLTATAVGATAGGLAASAVSKRFGPGAVLLAGKGGVGVAVLGLGLVADVWVAAFMMMATGALTTAQNVVVSTLRQQIVPRRLLGRVLSSSRMVVMIGGPIGAALSGILADAFGVRIPYVAGGVFLILLTLVAYPRLNNRALASATEASAVRTGEPG